MQREESFPEYPPGAFASVARFHRGFGGAAFDFDQDGQRWTVASVDRGAMGDRQDAPRLPRDVTGPHDLPLLRLDDDMDSMRGWCEWWLAELGA